jgi:phenylpropionate dioxygenase-like ring-hydroxylating dioxygenase large terminal subunit
VNPESKERLVRVARDALSRARDDTIRQAPDVMRVPASHYTDPARFARERTRLFRRVPLMLAASCELPRAGDFKTLDVAGVPVLLVRHQDGQARAFLNGCTHRGSPIAAGCGNRASFVCNYHGWTFNRLGELVGIAARRDFGDVDPRRMHLKQFPLLERAGLIWGILDPNAALGTEEFLGGIEEQIAGFGFESWHYLDRRVLKGANWKLAFDAHLEFYHLPVLHRETFGPTISNRTLYYFWGPHQRLGRPSARPTFSIPEDHDLARLEGRPEAEWSEQALLFGEWILFPNVSLNRFYEGGQGVIISQVFPGAARDESITVQTYILERPPSEAERKKALDMLGFLEHVVRDEDLANSFAQQRVLDSGALEEVCFGRNEAGLQHFHRWLDAVIEADDVELARLFQPRRGGDPLAWLPPAVGASARHA